MTTTPKPRRRWFQFRLRTLFVLMLVACIGMSWFAMKMQRFRKQRAAVDAIERLGGSVTWSSTAVPEESAGRMWLRKLLGDDFFAYPEDVEINNDAAMEYLKDLTQISDLALIGTQYTDTGLKYLKGLTGLRGLFLLTPQVTDAGLEHLKELTQLQWLYIESAQMTDAGLEHVKGLTQLEDLTLIGSQVTDSGLAHLKELTQLQSLGLSGTQVTDGGLDHLKGLSQLTELRLENTQVSDSGVKRLKQALPNCRISRRLLPGVFYSVVGWRRARRITCSEEEGEQRTADLFTVSTRKALILPIPTDPTAQHGRAA